MSKRPSVGGQAVIEGVMMRNGNKYAVAIRKPDHSILVDQRETVSLTEKNKVFGLPFIRGVVSFVESMIIGMKILTFSAEFFEVEDVEESKIDRWLKEKFGEKADDLIIGISVILALFMSVGLFVVLPLAASQLLKPLGVSSYGINFVDGLIRVALFLGYLTLISKMKDIQRVFQYHGAEHKSIRCYEEGLPLTVENAKKQVRFHKRCGTSFLLYVVAISILLLTVINVDTIVARLVVRIIMLPVIAGISYEVLKLLGRSNSKVLNILTKPGLYLQRLTTAEPDDEQLEVALKSLESVLSEEDLDLNNKETIEKGMNEDVISGTTPA